MPWITVIQGKSFTIKTDDPYEVNRIIEKDSNYAEIVSQVEKSGLKVFETSNTDDDELCISMGKELYKDRHIFQGLSVTVDSAVSAEEQANIEAFSVRMHDALADLGHEFETKSGLVISQFD